MDSDYFKLCRQGPCSRILSSRRKKKQKKREIIMNVSDLF